MTINQRVKKYFILNKISQVDFCKSAGYSENNLSNVIRGRTKLPRVDLIEAFMRFDKNLNYRWLVLGEGKMYEESEDRTSSDSANLSDDENLKEKFSLLESQVTDLLKILEEKGILDD